MRQEGQEIHENNIQVQSQRPDWDPANISRQQMMKSKWQLVVDLQIQAWAHKSEVRKDSMSVPLCTLVVF